MGKFGFFESMMTVGLVLMFSVIVGLTAFTVNAAFFR